MRVFVNPCDLHAVGFYRVLVPWNYMKTLGHDVTIALAMHPRMLGGFDVLVVHWARSDEHRAIMKAFQATGGKVIYEIDDDPRDLAWTNPMKRILSKEDHERCFDLISIADAVTVTSPYLKDALAGMNEHVFVCRNCLDPNLWGKLALEERDIRPSAIRIGWAGTTSQHYDDLQMVRRPLIKFLKERPDAQFLIATENQNLTTIFPRTVADQVVWMGSTFDSDPNNKITGVRMMYSPGELLPTMKMPSLLAHMDLDIAIAPIVKRPYSLAKSWIKLLEYGAAGFPSIASNYGPYQEYSQLYPECIWVCDDAMEEWYSSLRHLADRPDLRLRLARRNAKIIRENHMIEQHLHEWQAVLDYLRPDLAKGTT